jgi:bla regulator protein BlaR1
VPALGEGLESFFGWVVHTSWQVSILIALVLLVQFVFRKRLTAHWRYALWFLVVARLMLPSLPQSPFSLFNVVFRPEAIVAGASTALSLETVTPEEEVGPLPKENDEPGVVPNSESRAVPSIAQTTPDSAAPPGFGREFVLSLVWFAVFLFILAVVGAQVCVTRFQVWRLPALDDPVVHRLLDDCKADMGVRKSIRLVEAPDRSGPALMGIWKPVLLLPWGAAGTIGPQRLRFIFIHELAHLRHLDIWVNGLALTLAAFHWFNPLVWYAVRKMRRDQELACDARVLSRVGASETQEYVETILQILECSLNGHHLPGTAGIIENDSHINRRLRMIVDFEKPGRGWSAFIAFLTVFLGLITLTDATANIAAAGFQTVFRAPPLELQPTADDAGRHFGNACSSIPDVNGDGYGDVLVGHRAAGGESTPSWSGRAYIFDGRTGNLLRPLSSSNPMEGGRFGNSVCGIPDVDGDGRGEAVVAADMESGHAGRVYIFSGSNGHLLRELAPLVGREDSLFGWQVSGSNEAHLGKRTILAIAARRPRCVYVLDPLNGALLHTLTSFGSTSEFGRGLSVVPDVNDDGYEDVLVGDPRFATREIGAGRVELFDGHTGALLRTFVSPVSTEMGFFGLSVAGIPDVDGDGAGDVAIRARMEGPRESKHLTGKVFVFSGATGKLLYSLCPFDGVAEGYFACSLSAISDVNWDGVNDLIVGEHLDTPGFGHPQAGCAYVFDGATGLLLQKLISPRESNSGRFGCSVAGIPAPSLDAKPRIFVGADNDGPNGCVYLFSGSESPPTDGVWGFLSKLWQR